LEEIWESASNEVLIKSSAELPTAGIAMVGDMMVLVSSHCDRVLEAFTVTFELLFNVRLLLWLGLRNFGRENVSIGKLLELLLELEEKILWLSKLGNFSFRDAESSE
jgi:hypothetical protein